MESFSDEGIAFRPTQGGGGVVAGSNADGHQNQNREYGREAQQREDQPVGQSR
jgi:hypothetical protein